MVGSLRRSGASGKRPDWRPRMSISPLEATRLDSTPRAARTASPWLVLVLVGLAQFMVVLDATIVNVALPSIQRGLNMTSTNLQWIVNAYTLAFGGFLLLGGRAADLFGRKRLFLIGVA